MAILLFVLLLWAGAISLFYHQWGKIRGIDDYQPDYVHANMTIHPNPFPEESSEIGVSKQTVHSMRRQFSIKFQVPETKPTQS